MRTLVDTNLLFYAVNKEAPEHAKTAAFLERLWSSGDVWCLTWTNVYELLKLLTHPAVLPAPLSAGEACETIRRILEHPSLELLQETERHYQVLGEVVSSVSGARGSFFHDCRIAALMREHDVRIIATADTDFRKFAFLKTVDPTRG